MPSGDDLHRPRVIQKRFEAIWKTPRTVIEVYRGSDAEAMRWAEEKRRRPENRAAER